VLRVSARSNKQNVDVEAVRDGVSTGDPVIDTLVTLSEAILTGDNLDDLRERGRELLGPDGYRDAVAVAAYFDAVDRIADAAGAVVDNDNIG
jgi:hypothetical protein